MRFTGLRGHSQSSGGPANFACPAVERQSTWNASFRGFRKSSLNLHPGCIIFGGSFSRDFASERWKTRARGGSVSCVSVYGAFIEDYYWHGPNNVCLFCVLEVFDSAVVINFYDGINRE